MHILLACDKFKGTLTSAQVAAELTPPLTAAGHTVASVPIADGGDGTVAAALAAGFEQRTATVAGPLGHPVEATWAQSGRTAIVELAEASGIALVSPTRDTALNAGTHGTGEVVAAALDAGCSKIVLAVGGSSSTDGGAGMLAALGAQFLNDSGQSVPTGGLGLLEVAQVDLTGLDDRLRDVEVVLASDVDNPLLGETGAAAVYGPQKGASDTEVALLDRALTHLRDRFADAGGADAEAIARIALTPGAGAAGGTGFGALAGLGAQVRPGADYIMELVGFEDAFSSAELVVTGEGRFDVQTLSGKGPGAVIDRGREAGVPVWVVCGAAEITSEEAPGVSGIVELRSLAPEETCMTSPAAVVRQAGERLAELLRA
ncbi:MAG: glycerate kinase [Brevibacterium yomogidense]|uniref:Glycerate kinase n=1 Tax=Brevibacterium yomogidense TaxID=946573 RepID=A0A1X6WU02_9MICO|nr:glycerate kinase [Brevibacterium yomogidense]SLM88592.1 Glycerate kinase [Brevibacterium yomogidense]